MDPQSPRTKNDVSMLGPQVGEQVPDYSLKDQNGKTWTRQSIMGVKGAMLVFIYSAAQSRFDISIFHLEPRGQF